MSKSNTNGRNLKQEARVVVHEDERAIVKMILSRALGDDDCFVKFVPGDRSQSGRADDRLVLARFLERMERQFALRAAARVNGGPRPSDGRMSSGQGRQIGRIGRDPDAKRKEAA